jgi:LysM repeat protein
MQKFVLGAGVSLASLLILISRGTTHAQSIKQENKPKNVYVVIKKNDTLTKIAKKHNSSYVRIFNANKKIKNPNIIYPGDKLRIPANNEKLPKRIIGFSVQNKVVSNNKSQLYSVNSKYSSSKKSSGVNASIWDKLAACESGGNWGINTGNGYYGGLQFTASTWRSVGGSGLPHQNSRLEQIKRGKILQARSGWGQWPACTSKLGLR